MAWKRWRDGGDGDVGVEEFHGVFYRIYIYIYVYVYEDFLFLFLENLCLFDHETFGFV